MKNLCILLLTLVCFSLSSCSPTHSEIASNPSTDCNNEEVNSAYILDIKPILTQKNCASCHGKSGIATATRFKFGTDLDDQTTISAIKNLVNTDDTSLSLILTKPSGTVAHAGGALIANSSEDYQKLLSFAALSTTNTCVVEQLCKIEDSIPQKKVRRLTEEQIKAVVKNAYNGSYAVQHFDYKSFFISASELGFTFDSEKMLVGSLNLQRWASSVAEKDQLYKQLHYGPSTTCRNNFTEVCIDYILEEFGFKLLRRPLTQDEISEVKYGVETIKGVGASSEQQIAFVHKYLLLHPSLFFRTEVGVISPDLKEIVELDQYEVASFLSYTVLGGAPDSELYEKAAQGLLKNPDVITEQIARLIADPNAKISLRNFFMDLLKVNTIDQVGTERFRPYRYSPNVRVINYPDGYNAHSFKINLTRLYKETEIFIDRRLGENFNYMNVFQGNNFPVTKMNIALYGIRDYNEFGPLYDTPSNIIANTSDDGNDTLQDVIDYTAPVSERNGILTHPAFLATHSNVSTKGMVKRGVFILEQLLCHEMPSAPADISPIEEAPVGFDPTKLTSRQKFEILHSDQNACKFCHKSIDNIGGALENFANTGAFETTESFEVDGSDYTLDIISSGEITDLEGINIKYDNSVSFTKEMASSERFKSCINTRLLEYITGEKENDRNKCDYENQSNKLNTSGSFSYKDLISNYFNRDQIFKRTTGAEE